jgi:hypothetical protein
MRKSRQGRNGILARFWLWCVSMHQRPSGDFTGAHSRAPTSAEPRRFNWSLLSAVCLGLSLLVVGAVLVGVFAVAEPPNLQPQVVSAVEQRSNSAVPREAYEMNVRALLPAVANPADEGGGTTEPSPAQVPTAVTPGAEVVFIAIPVAVPAAATTQLLSASGTPNASPTASNSGSNLSAAAAAAQPPSPPLAAELGVTYCGMVTCDVGSKCCCSACVPADQACEVAACEAYSGLSVSVPCGMDLCDSGEICCDPRCGACGRAGECPEEPCD